MPFSNAKVHCAGIYTVQWSGVEQDGGGEETALYIQNDNLTLLISELEPVY